MMWNSVPVIVGLSSLRNSPICVMMSQISLCASIVARRLPKSDDVDAEMFVQLVENVLLQRGSKVFDAVRSF